MDLRPTDEQNALRETLRRLLDRRLAELTDALPEPPRSDPKQAIADAAGVGLLGLGLPEAAGGLGTFTDLALAHEELGRGLAAPALTVATLASRLVLAVAAPPRAQSLLALAAEGSLLLTPVGDGREVEARELGDGLRLSGTTAHVVDGPAADAVVLPAHLPGGEAVVALVAPDSTGVSWVEEERGCDVAAWTMTLDGVVVGADDVLSRDAARALQTYADEAAVLAGARAVGGGFAVLDRTVDYVKTRVQFERPIGTFQAVQHQLADVATTLDAAWLAVAQAATAVEQLAPAQERSRTATMAALAASDAFRAATLVAHQMHGGMGFVLDSPLHLWSARAVADPTLLCARRHLLDRLADASGLSAQHVVVAADHRSATA